MIVRKRDPKHRAGQHVHDRALDTDRFLRIHVIDVFIGSTVGDAASVPSFGKQAASPTEETGSTGDYSRTSADRRRRKDADVPRADALRLPSVRDR